MIGVWRSLEMIGVCLALFVEDWRLFGALFKGQTMFSIGWIHAVDPSLFSASMTRQKKRKRSVFLWRCMRCADSPMCHRQPVVPQTARCATDSLVCHRQPGGQPGVPQTARCASDSPMCHRQPDVPQTARCATDSLVCLRQPDVPQTARCATDSPVCQSRLTMAVFQCATDSPVCHRQPVVPQTARCATDSPMCHRQSGELQTAR